MGRPNNKQLLGKHEQGTKRRREAKVQEVAKERATPIRVTKHNGCSSKASARMARTANSSTRLGQAKVHR